MNPFLLVAIALSWCAIVAGCWLGWQLLRQNGRVLLRIDELEKRLNELEFGEESEPAGLPLGSAAPEFDLPDLAGQHHALTKYRGQKLLLIFFNPACGFCRELAPKLAALGMQKPEVAGQGSAASVSSTAAGEPVPANSRPVVLTISTG